MSRRIGWRQSSAEWPRPARVKALAGSGLPIMPQAQYAPFGSPWGNSPFGPSSPFSHLPGPTSGPPTNTGSPGGSGSGGGGSNNGSGFWNAIGSLAELASVIFGKNGSPVQTMPWPQSMPPATFQPAPQLPLQAGGIGIGSALLLLGAVGVGTWLLLGPGRGGDDGDDQTSDTFKEDSEGEAEARAQDAERPETSAERAGGS